MRGRAKKWPRPPPPRPGGATLLLLGEPDAAPAELVGLRRVGRLFQRFPRSDRLEGRDRGAPRRCAVAAAPRAARATPQEEEAPPPQEAQGEPGADGPGRRPARRRGARRMARDGESRVAPHQRHAAAARVRRASPRGRARAARLLPTPRARALAGAAGDAAVPCEDEDEDEDDALGFDAYAESMAAEIDRADYPMVIAIPGRRGSGKSFLLRSVWRALRERERARQERDAARASTPRGPASRATAARVLLAVARFCACCTATCWPARIFRACCCRNQHAGRTFR